MSAKLAGRCKLDDGAGRYEDADLKGNTKVG